MNCPECQHEPVRTDTTLADGSVVVRKRSCPHCGARFITEETIRHITNTGNRQCVPASTGTHGQTRASGPDTTSRKKERSKERKISDPDPSPSEKGAGETAPEKLSRLTNSAMGWFRNHWQSRYRIGWAAEPGIRSALKVFIGELLALPNGDDEVAALDGHMGAYLASNEPWLVGASHPLRTFLQNANKYRAPAPKQGSLYGRIA